MLCPNFDTIAKGDSNLDSFDCESGVLSLSYRAPQEEGLVVDGEKYNIVDSFCYLCNMSSMKGGQMQQ